MLKNTTVFFEKGKFGGWPANNGMWNWGNEILVGFSVDEFEVDPEGGHAVKTDAEGTVTLQLESVLEVFLELREEGWTSSKSNHVIDDIIEELQYHEFHVIACKYCKLKIHTGGSLENE